MQPSTLLANYDIRISILKDNFILATGGKQLLNKEATVESENLNNSMVTQRAV